MSNRTSVGRLGFAVLLKFFQAAIFNQVKMSRGNILSDFINIRKVDKQISFL